MNFAVMLAHQSPQRCWTAADDLPLHSVGSRLADVAHFASWLTTFAGELLSAPHMVVIVASEVVDGVSKEIAARIPAGDSFGDARQIAEKGGI